MTKSTTKLIIINYANPVNLSYQFHLLFIFLQLGMAGTILNAATVAIIIL